MNDPKFRVVDLLLLSVIVIWGLNFSILKLLYRYLDPLAFNALRFSVSCLTMVLLLKCRNQTLRIERRDAARVVGLGLLANTLYQVLFVLGLAHTRAGNAGLLMAFSPVFAYLTGVFLRRERFHRNVLGGILLSVAGVAAVILFGSGEISFGQTWKGDIMILGSAFCWGCYTGSASSMIAKYGVLRLTVLVMLAGTLFMVPFSLPWIVRQNWRAIPPGAWLAFCYATFLAIVYSSFAWSYALSRIGVARTAVYSNVIPLVALSGAWVLLGELPRLSQLVGVTLILTGVFIVRLHGPSDRLTIDH